MKIRVHLVNGQAVTADVLDVDVQAVIKHVAITGWLREDFEVPGLVGPRDLSIPLHAILYVEAMTKTKGR